MHSKIEHLSTEEKQLIHDAPILITVLISGADGNFDHAEIKKAVSIIHIKSFSEAKDVRGVYKNIDAHSEENIEALIHSLPSQSSDRTTVLKKKLSGLNAIFPKLDHHFAIDLYKSLRELAYYVSRAHDGDLGIGFHNEREEKLVQLDFLHEQK